MLISILAFALVFTFIALTHEFGHLIWAKRAGIRVFEFGLGFGPRLFAFEKGGTTYSVNLIPILGFIRIAGEGDSEADKLCPANENFNNKPPAQKFKAIIAGPLMNILAAIIILFLLFSFAGIPQGVSNEIGAIAKNSPAEKAGLRAGDRILSINGQTFPDFEKAIAFIHQSTNKKLSIIVDRNSRHLSVSATPAFNKSLKVALLGFSPKPIYQKANLLSAAYRSLEQIFNMVVATLVILWGLVTGGVSIRDIAGPIGIAQVTGKYAQSGLISFVYFVAFINVNLGVINLLPLPALDGGHLLIIILEALRRKPFNPELVNKINAWGMSALLALMAIVSLSDLLRLFGR
ncbi:MAG: RIP metalloprotease RseP [Candidatus Margulisbacteria bacterium]|nr:RIP metalloprotease RseP [Candidatus Margulisiibacteriota bacterium]